MLAFVLAPFLQGSYPMKACLLTAVAAGALCAVSPANAVIQIAVDVNGATFFCGEGMACDINPMKGTVQIAPTTLNGLFFAGEIGTSTSPGPPDILNNSVLISDNTTKTVAHVTVAVSDTGFKGPVTAFAIAGSGTWQDTISSQLTFKWFADPANVQGAANAFDTPGIDLATFNTIATTAVQGFSEPNVTGVFDAAGPFSMTLQSSYTLQPGGELVNRGLTETMSVPEPRIVALLGVGLVVIGFLRFTRRSKAPRWAI